VIDALRRLVEINKAARRHPSNGRRPSDECRRHDESRRFRRVAVEMPGDLLLGDSPASTVLPGRANLGPPNAKHGLLASEKPC
jgi:hypothetical protein